jgi:V/A-type H+-transporting ATPase subunit A
MSGRLEEMPGEEGYPAYLSSRLSEFYERAGVVRTLSSDSRTGSISAIGAVSPPGGDMSEPVSQATLRIVKVFWGLSSSLAYKRHFPAIDWLVSYSLYADNMSEWYRDNVAGDFVKYRTLAMSLLQEEASLDEIVRLVGMDALSARDRVVMETAKSIREDYLHQNAFHETDTYASLEKQFKILRLILQYYELSVEAVETGATLNEILSIPAREKIGRAKYIPEAGLAELDALSGELKAQMKSLSMREGA